MIRDAANCRVDCEALSCCTVIPSVWKYDRSRRCPVIIDADLLFFSLQPLESYNGLPPWKLYVLHGTAGRPDPLTGLFLHQSRVVGCSPGGHRLVCVQPDGPASTLLELAADMEPVCGASLPGGDIAVGDARSNRIVRVRADGSVVWMLNGQGALTTAEAGTATGSFGTVACLVACEDGRIIVVDAARKRLHLVSAQGAYLSALDVTGLEAPVWAQRHESRLFVLDAERDVVVVVELSTGGRTETISLARLKHSRGAPARWSGLTVSQCFGSVSVLVSDSANARVVTVFYGSQGTLRDFNVPPGPVSIVDNERALYVAFTAGPGCGVGFVPA